MEKMQPVGTWLKEGVEYLVNNWLMLFKAYAWGMLMYIVSTFVMMLGVAAVVAVGAMIGLTWNIGTGIVAFVLWAAGLLFLFSMAGKMIYLLILASKSPIADIREAWGKITWKDGLSLYFVLLIVIFAGYAGMIFLIIPGIVVFTWVSMAIFVRVEQGIGGVQALMVSRDYVRGYFWPILGRFLILMLISMALGLVTALGFSRLLEAGGMLAFLGWIFYMLGMFVVMAGIYRLMCAMYLDMVRIKGKLELASTPWRTFRWSLLAYSPLTLAVVAMILFVVLNPAKQIQKAKDVQLQQQHIMMQR